MADKEPTIADPIVTSAAPDTPEDAWKQDARLDENGNPVETPVETVKEPVADPAEDSTEVPPDAEDTPDETPTEQVDFSAPIVKQIETLVTQAGLDAKDVAKAVTENGGKLPPELAKAIVDKHGELVAGLVADKLETFHKTVQAQAKEKATRVFSKLEESFKDVTTQSGEQTWKELQAWTKENVPANERAEINKLLQSGGLSAELAVDNLVARFKAKNTTTQEPELEEGSTALATGITPLSRADYLREFDKLEKAGHVYGQSAAFKKLDAQRLAGRQRNL